MNADDILKMFHEGHKKQDPEEDIEVGIEGSMLDPDTTLVSLNALSNLIRESYGDAVSKSFQDYQLTGNTPQYFDELCSFFAVREDFISKDTYKRLVEIRDGTRNESGPPGNLWDKVASRIQETLGSLHNKTEQGPAH